MLKKLSLITCILFSVLNVFSQAAIPSSKRSAFEDAVYLRKFVTSTSKIAVQADNRDLFDYYFNSQNLTGPQLDIMIHQNPFFDNSIVAPLGGAQAPLDVTLPANIPTGTGISVANFADGLTQFLIKRAKEELLIAFFSRLQDPKQAPEFRQVFPNTAAVVDNFNAWEYANIVNTLRSAFNKDLKNILADLPNLSNLNPGDYTGSVKTRVQAITHFLATDNGRILISAMQIGNGFINGLKMPDVIDAITGNKYLGNLSNVDEQNIIKLLDVLSSSVRSSDPNKSYISLTDFTTDPITLQIYGGLVYQQILNAQIKIGGHDIARDIKNNIALIKNYVAYAKSLVTHADQIDVNIANLKTARARGETDLTKYWGAIFESSKQFLLYAENTTTIDPAFTLPKHLQEAIDMSANTLEVATDIGNKNYSDAITVVLKMISDIVGNQSDKSGFGMFFVKYASFAASIVQAKSSTDIENAIETVALPAGSASIKKNTNFSIALNGYIGGAIGEEYLAQKASSNWGTISGAYAPIGVTFSKRIYTSSVSLFVQLIDLGAVASYRLSDPNTASLPNFSFQNILAPGLGIIYGIPGMPVSIGYIDQLGPQLRSINATDVVTSQGLNRRWQFFIAVDIPLFSLYAKSKQ
jgi:hypothetical protein